MPEQPKVWDRFPRIVFQGNAGAFVLFAWWHRGTPEVAWISLAFAGFMLVCWGILFASHLKAETKDHEPAA